MIKKLIISIAVCLVTTSGYAQKMASDTTPVEDLQVYRDYAKKRHGNVATQDFVNGVYAIDKTSRESWEAIEEFPPYEPFIDEGEEMWNTPFANGKTYASCFNHSAAQRKNYPHWDSEKKMVMTLALAVNNCREANGEKPLKYAKGSITSLLAYMGYESRGQMINVKVPNDPGAIAAYNNGKSFYFTRRGQLNFACSQCHMESSGLYIRADILSPALGQASGWPTYRSKWGDMGTLHRRFKGCNKQVRAKPFKPQSKEYRDLEYFLTHMSNGLQFNGPAARK